MTRVLNEYNRAGGSDRGAEWSDHSTGWTGRKNVEYVAPGQSRSEGLQVKVIQGSQQDTEAIKLAEALNKETGLPVRVYYDTGKSGGEMGSSFVKTGEKTVKEFP